MTTVDFQEDGNYLTLNGEGQATSGFKNPEDFIAFSGIDLKVWRQTRVKLNSWPTSGWDNDAEQPWSVINLQCKIDFVRREPKALAPQVQPVKIHPTKRTQAGRNHHGLKTAVHITDPHFGFSRDIETGDLTPFHDRRALDIAAQMIHRLRPDDIVISGDLLDLPDWSTKFVRSPEFYFSTQPAVVEASWWLARFRRTCLPARIVALEGNHDARMENALVTHLNNVYRLKPADEMELPPSMSVPRLLAMHKLEIEYIGGYPDADLWLNDRLVVTHGAKARSAPGGTVGAEVRESDITLVHGHIHRREWASRTIHGRHGRRVIESVCPGCICHIDGRVPSKAKKLNWQQGLTVIRYDDHGRYTITPVAISNGEAIFEGEIYRGKDPVAEIAEETGWDF